jgi:hypothetical protein
MKDRKEKQVLSGDRHQWEGEIHKERVKESEYGGNIMYSYENGIVRHVKLF